MRELTVGAENAGGRLDKYLLKYLNRAPKSFIYKMLREKRIKLNGGRAQGSEILSATDCIRMYLADETVDKFSCERNISAAPPLSIIFEDDNLLMVNKPAGLLTHSDTAAEEDTLASRLVWYLSQTADMSVFTPAPSNRLDRNTSGIVACGKHPAAVRALNNMLAERSVDKYYAAAVAGQLHQKLRLTGFLKKDAASNTSSVTSTGADGGKAVAAEYEPVGMSGAYTLLRVKLLTGKPHQIRAQLQAAGYPVLGDPKYGDPRVNELLAQEYGVKHQMLHAYSLTCRTQAGMLARYRGRTWVAPLPQMFIKVFHILSDGVMNSESYNSGGGLCH
jgi:23S rRNA pseudouridine955/2504/2580 synthase